MTTTDRELKAGECETGMPFLINKKAKQLRQKELDDQKWLRDEQEMYLELHPLQRKRLESDEIAQHLEVSRNFLMYMVYRLRDERDSAIDEYGKFMEQVSTRPLRPEGGVREERRNEFIGRTIRELEQAYNKHGNRPWTRHEFYAILKEEVDELWDAIKRDAPMEEIEKEMIQVSAMPLRFFETSLLPQQEGKGE